ncbi:MAG: UDP-N-acetylmuramoyl-tripeptide--D-alanyl-D-alanine ligase [Chloroflexota bacterium]
MLTLADVFQALTDVRPHGAEIVLTEATIDSRQAIPGALFVALVGERADGHNYVGQAFQRGAVAAIIEHEVAADLLVIDLRQGFSSDTTFESEQPLCLLVESSLLALQKVARFWRQKLTLSVIGITGSVGKSTTKELVAEVIGQRYRTLKNPGNLNNEIGLPLTLLSLGEGYQRAVLEMGFYVPGEIALLCELAKPHIGIVTNIGAVHASRAGSIEEIARGKTELVQALPADGWAVLNYDDPLVRQMAEKTQAQVFFYGLDSEADLWADEVEGLGLEGIGFRLHFRREILHLRVPMIGRHSVHTALRAAATGLIDGLGWQEIVTGLRSSMMQLRLVAVRTPAGALLLDDTYNASPESTLAALNLLDELDGRKVAVLGDMLELGPYEQQGHEMVGVRAAQVAGELVAVGERARVIARAARNAGMPAARVREFENSQQAIKYLQKNLSDRDTVLVKGSRGMRMDRIVNALEVEVEA